MNKHSAELPFIEAICSGAPKHSSKNTKVDLDLLKVAKSVLEQKQIIHSKKSQEEEQDSEDEYEAMLPHTQSAADVFQRYESISKKNDRASLDFHRGKVAKHKVTENLNKIIDILSPDYSYLVPRPELNLLSPSPQDYFSYGGSSLGQ